MSSCCDCINKQHPKISIVLPTFNGSRWLADSIESVLSQSEQDWELIIVNDCSTDRTLEIAEKYAHHDPRIKVYSNSINKKLPASLNIGFSHATGQYRTWTSDDNMFKPNALSVMAGYLDTHPNTDMVAANMDLINEDGTVRIRSNMTYRKPEQLSYECNVGAAFMYRESVAKKIGDYDEKYFCAEDYDYWCRMALAGTINYIKDNIYLYRENPQSLSATKKALVLETTALLQNKYKQHFVGKFKLTWWQREKREYLIDKNKHRKTSFLFWVRRNLVGFFLRIFFGIFFFWNRQLRKRMRNITRIRI